MTVIKYDKNLGCLEVVIYINGLRIEDAVLNIDFIFKHITHFTTWIGRALMIEDDKFIYIF